MAYRMVEVREAHMTARNVASLTVPAGGDERPGQFYMLRRPDAAVLLPRAVSVCDVGGGALRFLIQLVGPGTAALGALRAGDGLALTGPLGNGFPVDEYRGKAVALVGGGIGVAPMLYTAKALAQAGASVDCCAGFRDEAFLLGELRPHVREMRVATESGAVGHKGYVTDLLEAGRYDAVFACGPEPMLKAAVARCREAGTPVYVSMENRMACGLGACLVCTCTDVYGKNRRTCKDGPVFRGEEIDFDA